MSVSSPTDPIRVFLLDDHEVVRRGVAAILEAEGDIEVVGEAGDAQQALDRVPALKPDVAVLDIRLGEPGADGVLVCRELRSRMPELRCLMLTSFSDEEALLDALLAGASGYVLKQIQGNDLVGAVRELAAGRSLLDTESTARIMEHLRRDPTEPDSPVSTLSAQERRILDHIGEGLTNREIGLRLHLAEKTVKNYVSSIFAKLGMVRRTQAAALAARLNMQEDSGR